MNYVCMNYVCMNCKINKFLKILLSNKKNQENINNQNQKTHTDNTSEIPHRTAQQFAYSDTQ